MPFLESLVMTKFLNCWRDCSVLQVVPGVKVIFASSIAVFGGEFSGSVTENTLPTPTTSYGTEKMVFSSIRQSDISNPFG